MCLQDFPADFCCLRWGRGDGSTVCPHHFPAERLLLIGNLHHENLQIQAQVSAGHGQGSTPLAGTGLCGDTGQALLLRIVCLGDGGIQLVAAAGVVAFELIVDVRRCTQLLLQAVSPDQRGRTVHLVEISDFLRDVEVCCVIVQLLLHQFPAEHMLQFLCRHRLVGGRVQQRCRLLLHIRPNIVILFRHLVFCQVDLVRDLVSVGCHFHSPSVHFASRVGKEYQKNSCPSLPCWDRSSISCGATRLDVITSSRAY